MVDEHKSTEKKPDPERVKVLQSLPKEIMASLTKEEVVAFLGKEVWPETLKEKLKDYLVD